MNLGEQAGLKPYEFPLRNVFGQALLQVCQQNPKVVVLDGDLGNSTKAETVRNAFPDRRPRSFSIICPFLIKNIIGILSSANFWTALSPNQ